MDAIVHIGLSKTGTTSIQRYLFANETGLAAQGFAVARPGFHPDSFLELPVAVQVSSGGVTLNDWVKATNGFDTDSAQANMANAAEKAIATAAASPNCKTVILSSEHLFPWMSSEEPNYIQALDDYLGKTFESRRYICYIREPMSWLLSLYSQSLRNGARRSLKQFMEMAKDWTTADQIMRWSSILGSDRFSVRVLDRSRLVGGDVVADFAQFAGFDLGASPRAVTENQSLTLTGAYATLGLNRAQKSLFLESSNLSGLRAQIDARAVDGPKLGLPPGDWSGPQAWAKIQRRKLRETFFPQETTLFPKGPRFVSAAQDAKARDDAAEILATLLLEHGAGRNFAVDTLKSLRRSKWRSS